MDRFQEVDTRIAAVMATQRIQGNWIRSSWNSIPFAIVINEEAIIKAITERLPRGKFSDLDTIFDIIEIYSWGYSDEFSICEYCKEIIHTGEEHECKNNQDPKS